MAKRYPTQKFLKSIMRYNKRTGVFTWKRRSDVPHRINKQHAGKRAGSVSTNGRRIIKIDGIFYYASILAWIYVTGRQSKFEIDHKNRIKSDDRFNNLREATHAQNSRNRVHPTVPKSGERNIHFHTESNVYMVKFMINRRYRYFGSFRTVAEAIPVRDRVARKLHGKFSPSVAAHHAGYQ